VLELRAGGASASIDDAHGGRLASLRVGGRELLVGPSGPDDAGITWGCYLMAPWAGRLADGRLPWRGRTIQLRRTHGRHAIHGLVWAVPWRVVRATPTECELVVDLARDGWPFGGEVRQRFRLEPGRLNLDASIHADRPMPAALGWHPWFQRGLPDPSLHLGAEGILERRRMLPTGVVQPLSGKHDLRSGPVLGRRRLDDAYVGATSPVTLRWPDLELRLEFGAECGTVVVYTPWNAVCIEPQTAWPNALGLSPADAIAAGARFLAAGESLRGRLDLEWRLLGVGPAAGAVPAAGAGASVRTRGGRQDGRSWRPRSR
jgi:aldose 1-epimerase